MPVKKTGPCRDGLRAPIPQCIQKITVSLLQAYIIELVSSLASQMSGLFQFYTVSFIWAYVIQLVSSLASTGSLSIYTVWKQALCKELERVVWLKTNMSKFPQRQKRHLFWILNILNVIFIFISVLVRFWKKGRIRKSRFRP